MAARPLLSSMARFWAFHSSVCLSQPKSVEIRLKNATAVRNQVGEQHATNDNASLSIKIHTKSIAEVTGELARGGSVGRVLHSTGLKETNKDNHLDQTKTRDSVRAEESGNTIGVRVEGVSLEVNVARKVDSGTSGDLSKEGKLTDTSVLELDVSEALKSGSISIGDQTKRANST